MKQTFSAIIKRRSIELIRETKPSPLRASFLLFAVNSLVYLLIMFLTGYYDMIQETADAILAGRAVTYEEMYAMAEKYSSSGGTILAIILLLFVAIIGVGFKWYCFHVVRGEAPGARSIFDSFGSFFKIIRLSVVKGFLIYILLNLFILPGIIAMIRFSQAEYIMYEHPEYGAFQCLRESGHIMRGYKWEYFMLLMSFLAWFVIGFFVWLFVFPFPVLGLWVNIYWGLASALFHVHLMRAGLSGEDHRDSNVI